MSKYTKPKPTYYFYHKRLVRFFFEIIDSIGFYFFKSQPVITKSESKILVVNLGGAGDLIISEPLLSTLFDFSNQKIDLVCFPGQEKALLDLPYLGKFFYLELPWLGGKKGKRQSFVAWYKLIKVLRLEKYDIAFDVKGDPIIILLLLFSGIHFRVGFNNGGLGFLLTHPFSQLEDQKRFKTDLFLSEALALENRDYYREPQLLLLSNEPWANNITVHLGASVQARCWPLEYWAELLLLLGDKYQINIVGSFQDAKALFLLKPELVNLCHDYSGQSWLETARIIKKSSLFIGANSGPAHLAAALNCRVISIFSAANNPDVWAPPSANVLIFKPNCYNCELDYCSHLACLQAITPLMVYNTVSKVL